MGVIDVSSALLSHPPERLVALERFLPTTVLDTSRTFTLVAGVVLLVTAWGLVRGKRRSFVFALFLCALSVPMNLLKALDVEEATVAAGLLFALGVSGDVFRVRSRDWTWRGFVLLAVVAAALFGAWALAGNAWLAAHGARFTPALARMHRWFQTSLPLLGALLSLALAFAALQPAAHRRRHRLEAPLAHEVVAAWGLPPVAPYALGEDMEWFWSANGRAFLAYRYQSDVLLVAGGPIGPPEEAPALLDDFARFAAEHDWTFALYQARPEMLADCRERGWLATQVGEEPLLPLTAFDLAGSARGDVRRTVRKLEEAGVVFESHVPAADALPLAELTAISDEWLAARGGGELGFCMGRFAAEDLSRQWVVCARRPGDGRIEGFLTWRPLPAAGAHVLDLMRRRNDALHGVMDFLVARSALEAKARGEAVLSLGLAPLSRTAAADEPPEVERALALLRRRLAPVYDFDGLMRWKRKFDPVFEPRYLVVPGPLALPAAALALVRAQSLVGLASYVRRLLAAWPRAAAEER
jgi:lysylphosphatidylglycerol synthetase-like protein (DUF2156 family)